MGIFNYYLIRGNMTKNFEIYKCSVCGNVVEVSHCGEGTLTCCEMPMSLLDGKTTDGATEKHLPVVEIKDNKAFVTVGEVIHPMEEKHYISFIEVITPSNKIIKKKLNPNDEPKMHFCIKEKGEYIVREYCNLHGLWKTSIKA